MADITSAVRTYLISQTGARIYLDRLPQSAQLPACTIAKISERDAHTISDRAAFVHTRLNIAIHSLNRLATEALAEQLRASGVAALNDTTNGVRIHGCQIESGRRNYTIDARDGSDDHEYVTEFDLMVSYSE